MADGILKLHGSVSGLFAGCRLLDRLFPEDEDDQSSAQRPQADGVTGGSLSSVAALKSTLRAEFQALLLPRLPSAVEATSPPAATTVRLGALPHADENGDADDVNTGPSHATPAAVTAGASAANGQYARAPSSLTGLLVQWIKEALDVHSVIWDAAYAVRRSDDGDVNREWFAIASPVTSEDEWSLANGDLDGVKGAGAVASSASQGGNTVLPTLPNADVGLGLLAEAAAARGVAVESSASLTLAAQSSGPVSRQSATAAAATNSSYADPDDDKENARARTHYLVTAAADAEAARIIARSAAVSGDQRLSSAGHSAGDASADATRPAAPSVVAGVANGAAAVGDQPVSMDVSSTAVSASAPALELQHPRKVETVQQLQRILGSLFMLQRRVLHQRGPQHKLSELDLGPEEQYGSTGGMLEELKPDALQKALTGCLRFINTCTLLQDLEWATLLEPVLLSVLHERVNAVIDYRCSRQFFGRCDVLLDAMRVRLECFVAVLMGSLDVFHLPTKWPAEMQRWEKQLHELTNKHMAELRYSELFDVISYYPDRCHQSIA